MGLLSKFKNSSYKTIVENTLMLALLQFTNIALSMLTSGYQFRIFPQQNLVILGYANVWMPIFQLFIDFGFVISATGKISRNRENLDYVNKVFTCVTAAKTIFIGISCMILPFVLKNESGTWQEGLTYWLSMLSIATFAWLPDFVYRGFEQMSSIAVRSVTIKVLATVLIYVFIKEPDDYYMVPLFTVIGNLGAMFFVYLHLFKKLKVRFCKISFGDFVEEIKDSAQFFLSRIASTVYGQVNGIFLKEFAKDQFPGYDRGAMVTNAAKNGLVSPIADSLYPSIMRNRNFGIIKKALKLTLPIMLAGCSIVFIFAPQLCTLWLGAEKGWQAVVPLRALLPVVVISLPNYILGFPTLSPMGLSKYANTSITVGTVFHLVNIAILYFTGNINVLSLCISTSIAEFSILIFRVVVIYKNRNLLTAPKQPYEFPKLEGVEFSDRVSEKPVVSVIIPVYNVEDYLETCVASVLRQSFKDFEILLVDDGSTDSSGMLCDEYAKKDARIKVIHQDNKGLGGARNTGIDAAKGRYLFLLDSDDSILPETLETLVKTANDKNADIVIYDFVSVDEKGNELHSFGNDLPKNVPMNLKTHKQLILQAPNAWNKLYRADVFKKSGIRYPERLWYEDLHTYGKLLLHVNTVVAVEDKLYLYLQRDGSIMNNKNVTRNIEITDAVKAVSSYYEDMGLYGEYRDSLEFLSMNNTYMAAVRVVRGGTSQGRSVLDQLHTFNSCGKEIRRNPEYKALGRKQKLSIWLFSHKFYGILQLIYKKSN